MAGASRAQGMARIGAAVLVAGAAGKSRSLSLAEGARGIQYCNSFSN